MTKIASDREFSLVKDSFSTVKKINLKEIGFNQISGSDLYIYQSDEYKILNYSIKPELVFFIKNEKDNIYVKLKSISIKNLPDIFKTLKLTLELNIYNEKDLCKIHRHISLKFDRENRLISFISENFIQKILKNLIEKISIRFDKKLIKKVLKSNLENV